MAVVSIVGGPGANASANGGKVYAFNTINDVTATQCAPANPQRLSITFHNPGTIDILVAPLVKNSITNNATSTLTISTLVYGGAFRIYGNGGALTITGECQGGWQALAISGSTNPFTVLDSNI